MFGAEEKQAKQYRLLVSAAARGSEVKLMEGKKDRPVDSAEGKRFMETLLEELR